ncbi:hypothetical protein [Dictyobacter kobayashii]|uniref:hypothetical protein n=1 Tax=Dictyobacter kobayashii TaxID=2014872 RepID=UPI0010A95112|nr:hypothetical protein [Dictyobacter kobayashii]
MAIIDPIFPEPIDWVYVMMVFSCCAWNVSRYFLKDEASLCVNANNVGETDFVKVSDKQKADMDEEKAQRNTTCTCGSCPISLRYEEFELKYGIGACSSFSFPVRKSDKKDDAHRFGGLTPIATPVGWPGLFTIRLLVSETSRHAVPKHGPTFWHRVEVGVIRRGTQSLGYRAAGSAEGGNRPLRAEPMSIAVACF